VIDSSGTAAELAGALAAWFGRLWPDPERGAAAARAVLDRFGGSTAGVDDALCREVEAAVHPWSRHFALAHHPDGDREPDVDPPGWDPQDPDVVHARAAYLRRVDRDADGVAVVGLDGLDPVGLAAPYLEAAFALSRTARAVVLDLRDNGGGDPASLVRVLDWVRGPQPLHVADVHHRDRVRQWWTAGREPGAALAPGTPLAVATSARTFSSGEALAFHLQRLCGAVVVGEPSRGAADHITPVRVTRRVTAFLPEAYVVDPVAGDNWEGTGVLPDVPCAADEALAHAVEVVGRRT
jgi:hypothetical protein